MRDSRGLGGHSVAEYEKGVGVLYRGLFACWLTFYIGTILSSLALRWGNISIKIDCLYMGQDDVCRRDNRNMALTARQIKH